MQDLGNWLGRYQPESIPTLYIIQSSKKISTNQKVQHTNHLHLQRNESKTILRVSLLIAETQHVSPPSTKPQILHTNDKSTSLTSDRQLKDTELREKSNHVGKSIQHVECKIN